MIPGRKTQSKAVEFTIKSNRDFYVRALWWELHIGDLIVRESSYGKDGNLHTLIFIVDDISGLKDKSSMYVQYGESDERVNLPKLRLKKIKGWRK